MGTHIRLYDNQDEFVRLFSKKNGMSISDAANHLIGIAMESIEAGNLDFYKEKIKSVFQESLRSYEDTTGDKIVKRLVGLIALNTNYTLKGFWLIKDILGKLMLLEKENWHNLKDEALVSEVRALVEDLEKSSEGQMRAIYENNRKVKENDPQQND
ncbi:MAG: hypothetical protein M1467_04445 [Deltaproteobacteria bacterium]|nr:hypothetical protein [Deltaproteobacteria bacterium]